jgi:hypothetical protein
VTSQEKVAAEQICNGSSCGWCQMEKRRFCYSAQSAIASNTVA